MTGGSSGIPPGVASGLGPLPGTDVLEAVRTIAGELPDVPFRPELPDRGVGADPIGRSVAHLVDVPAEVVPSGWRISSRPGRDLRRALDLVAWDLDALQEVLDGAPVLKIQIVGPWSLVAGLELRTGHRVLTDPGAVADVTESYAEGLRLYLAELARRLPGTAVLAQIDEPQLSAVLDGSLPTASGFGTVRAVDAEVVRSRFALFAEVVRASGTVCGLGVSGVRPGPWYPILRSCGVERFTLELADLDSTASLDVVGELIGSGAGLQVGIDPVGGPDRVERTTRVLLARWRALGFDIDTLAATVLPVAGRPASSAQVAGDLAAAAEVGAALLDPPISWRERSTAVRR